MNTPTKHPHADKILEKARQDATGETEAGWWFWESRDISGKVNPCFLKEDSYRYNMTCNHPLFKPPKLKLVDMGKLPVGSMVNVKFLVRPLHMMVKQDDQGQIILWSLTAQTRTIKAPELRIAVHEEFTYWGGNSQCPVPDGLIIEFITRGRGKNQLETSDTGCWLHVNTPHDIIAYRIIGLANGWTDDPELAT